MGFGTLQPDFVELEEGILYGVWDSGPWLAFKKNGSSSFGWIGGGKGEGFQHQVNFSFFSRIFKVNFHKLKQYLNRYVLASI